MAVQAKLQPVFDASPLWLGFKSLKPETVGEVLLEASKIVGHKDRPNETLDFLRNRLADCLPVRNRFDDVTVPPEDQWLVRDWLPFQTGMLCGSGGLGKSRLALMLSCSVASGQPDWLPANDGDSAVMEAIDLPGPSAAVYASWEDSFSRIAKRRYWMGRKGDYSAAEAGKLKDRLHVLDVRKYGPAWGPHDGEHIQTRGGLLPVGQAIRSYCESIKARLLILDSAAACFGSEENSRSLVRPFLASWDEWAETRGCCVLVIGHPPKNGETPYSGSTDWLNGSRYMLELASKPSGFVQDSSGALIPKQVAMDEKIKGAKPAGAMKLSLYKANHSVPGVGCWLRWNPDGGGVWQQCGARESALDRLSRENGKPSKPSEAGNPPGRPERYEYGVDDV